MEPSPYDQFVVVFVGRSDDMPDFDRSDVSPLKSAVAER